MLTTGNQLRAARALVNMDQGTLAMSAGVNINTISSMEKKGSEVLTSGLDKVRAVMAVLEAAGIEFLNHGQPGVRLKEFTVAAAVRDGERGLWLTRGRPGSQREWLSDEEAQQEAIRARRRGDTNLAKALMITSQAPADGILRNDLKAADDD